MHSDLIVVLLSFCGNCVSLQRAAGWLLEFTDACSRDGDARCSNHQDWGSAPVSFTYHCPACSLHICDLWECIGWSLNVLITIMLTYFSSVNYCFTFPFRDELLEWIYISLESLTVNTALQNFASFFLKNVKTFHGIAWAMENPGICWIPYSL